MIRVTAWGRMVFCGLAFLTLTIPTNAQAISGGHAPTDDRFDAVAAFSHANWLGIQPGPYDSNWFCTATLIAPDKIMTARHCVSHPTDGTVTYAVRFRRRIDGGVAARGDVPAAYHHAIIDHFILAPSGDTIIGVLTVPVTHIAPLPIATWGVQGMPRGATIWHAGWGKEGPALHQGVRRELRLCQNELDSAGRQIIAVPAISPSHQCGINVHDSGSPMIYEHTDGSLRMIGVASNIANTSAGGPALYRYLGTSYPITHTPLPGLDLVLIARSDMGVFRTGETLEVTISIKNAGAASWSNAVAASISLSRNDGWDDHDDIELARVKISPNQSTFVATVSVPETGLQGSYHLRVVLDPDAQLPDTFRHNNVWSPGGPVISITPQPVGYRRFFFGQLAPNSYPDGLAFAYQKHDGTITAGGYSISLGRGFIGRDIPAQQGSATFTDRGLTVKVGLTDGPVSQISLSGQSGVSTLISQDFPGATAHSAGHYTGVLAAHGNAPVDVVLSVWGQALLLTEINGITVFRDIEQRNDEGAVTLHAGTSTATFAGAAYWDELAAAYRIPVGVILGPDASGITLFEATRVIDDKPAVIERKSLAVARESEMTGGCGIGHGADAPYGWWSLACLCLLALRRRRT